MMIHWTTASNIMVLSKGYKRIAKGNVDTRDIILYGCEAPFLYFFMDMKNTEKRK